MDKATVHLGLGSNLGDRKHMLTQALTYLSQKVSVEAVSSLYETKALYIADQPLFLNAVCRISTTLRPHQLLTLVKGIENKLGRLPDNHNRPRPIDVDILLYDNLIMQGQTLTIPHPLMLERAFVLIPLVEIAPDLVHPEAGMTISQLVKQISPDGVVRIESNIAFPEGGHHVPDIG